MNWQEFDKQHIWHPWTPLGADNILITSAKGIYLHTSDGRKIIDAVSSWWVNIHGHSHPAIAKAIYKQATELEHVIFAGFTHEPAVKLAAGLLKILPDNQNRIFFSDNGSTAVEVAIKMAIQHWYNQGIEKKRIVALEGAYHGDTFGAMSAAARGMFTRPFNSLLFDVDFIPFPSNENSLEVFERVTEKKDVAAFIFEPLVQAASGMNIYSPEMLDSLIKIARKNEVLCIADEVFTGFGRTGKLFASDYLLHKPDILALSKGLTGGSLPLGITSCSELIAEPFKSEALDKTFFHGHSFTGNPMACAAALASLELLSDPQCQQAIEMITQEHAVFCKALANNKRVRNVRNLGTLMAFDLAETESTSYDNAARKKIYSYFINRGILIRPLGNVIYLLPPYVISKKELHSIYSAIEEFLPV